MPTLPPSLLDTGALDLPYGATGNTFTRVGDTNRPGARSMLLHTLGEPLAPLLPDETKQYLSFCPF